MGSGLNNTFFTCELHKTHWWQVNVYGIQHIPFSIYSFRTLLFKGNMWLFLNLLFYISVVKLGSWHLTFRSKDLNLGTVIRVIDRLKKIACVCSKKKKKASVHRAKIKQNSSNNPLKERFLLWLIWKKKKVCLCPQERDETKRWYAWWNDASCLLWNGISHVFIH